MAKAKKQQTPQFPETTRGYNHFRADSNLQRLLHRAYPEMLVRQWAAFEDYAQHACTVLDDQATYSDRIAPPALRQRLDRAVAPEQREPELYLNAEYKDCQQEIYRHSFLAKVFDEVEPEPHIFTFMAQYLTSYTDISTGCPLAMTHPNALLLATRADENIAAKFLPQFLRTDGRTMIGGTWGTEWPGGSDIRGNTESEAFLKDMEQFECFVHGRNFFSSAIGFDSWGVVKTARFKPADGEEEGLVLVFIPSHLDENWDDDPKSRTANNISIAHLKDKSGTRGLPTAEVEIDGATGYIIADEKNGLRVMMEALGCSRIHNAMAASAVMHRAYNEALFWAANRETFGEKLITREDVQADLVWLKTEWQGGMSLAFEAAQAFDATIKDENNAPWLRLCTALAKYHTAEKCTEATAKATETIGGTGYTADHPIERINRDAMVLRVWEGPKNIQAREVLGMLARGGAEAFLDRLDEIKTALPGSMNAESKNIDKLRAKAAATFAAMTKNKGLPPHQGPALMDGLAKILTYSLLCDEAAHELAEYNDKSKLLTAQSYYGINKVGAINLRPSKTPLHNQFDKMVTGEAVPVKAAAKKPQP